MKYFLIALTFILLSGCSHKNAFSKFDMDEKQELGADSLQSSKITSASGINGVFSAIYLNKVYPETFVEDEYFFIYLYMKDNKEMFNPNTLDDIKLTLKVNGRLPIKVKQLEKDNQFSKLSHSSNEWTKYYLVAFNKTGKTLNLVLQSDQSHSDLLKYQKGEQ